MIKTTITFVLILLTWGKIVAQNVEWSEMSFHGDGRKEIHPIQGGEFLATHWPRGPHYDKPLLEYYKDFKLIGRARAKAKIGKRNARIVKVITFNGKVIVFLADNQKDLHRLYMQRYGTDCAPESAPVLLAEFTASKDWLSVWIFDVIQSKNQKYLCIEYDMSYRRGENERYGFKILNKEFETVSEGEYVSPYNARQSDISNRYLSNTGDYFFAAKVYNLNKLGLVKDISNLEKFVLVHVTSEGIEEMELNLGDKLISEATFSSDENQLMTFSGVYYVKSTNTNGIVYYQIDYKKKEILNQGSNEFSKALLMGGTANDEKEKADNDEANGFVGPLLLTYKFRESITLSDGSVIGMLEQYSFYETYSLGPNGMTSTHRQYDYNDILIYKISATGEIAWVKNIYKRQMSGLPIYCSVAHYLKDQKMVLFFNDSFGNYDENGEFIQPSSSSKIYGIGYGKKDHCMVRSEIDLNTGELERKIFLTSAEPGSYLVPRQFLVDYTRNEMLLYMHNGTKEKYGLLRF